MGFGFLTRLAEHLRPRRQPKVQQRKAVMEPNEVASYLEDEGELGEFVEGLREESLENLAELDKALRSRN